MDTALGFVSLLFAGALSEIALKLIGAFAIAYAIKRQVKRNIDQRHDLIRLAEIGKEVELKSAGNQGYVLELMHLVNLAASENLNIQDVEAILVAFSEHSTRNKKTGQINNIKWYEFASELGFRDSFSSQIVGNYNKIAEHHFSKKSQKHNQP